MEENENFRIPIPKFLVKDLTFLGLPFDIAILMGACILFSLIIFRNVPVTIVFLVVYIGLVIFIKLTPKFDPKILELTTNTCLKKYINY